MSFAVPADWEEVILDSSQSKQEVKQWCFTLNNYTEQEVNSLIKYADAAANFYVFGKECGSEKMTPHIQGFFNFKIKKSFSALKKINKRMSLFRCKGSEKQNITYCTKDGNYISNNMEKCKLVNKVKKPLKIISKLRAWQSDILKVTEKEADDRHIYWIYDPEGNKGKSVFCKYMCHHKGAIYIDEGKKSDIINIIYNINDIDEDSIICIDIPRDNGNKTSYKAIEQIKNGMICNTKYETGMKLFNSPHIFIFSNYLPELEKLSIDRWMIFEIENDNTLKRINADDGKI